MAITLPFEAGLNSYVTQELAFRYHYFFTRKLWMVFHCQALVVAPGGVGTMDELFEVMTLRQTGKVNTDLPIVLIGKTFWSTVVNWQVRLVLHYPYSHPYVAILIFSPLHHFHCSYCI